MYEKIVAGAGGVVVKGDEKDEFVLLLEETHEPIRNYGTYCYHYGHPREEPTFLRLWPSIQTQGLPWFASIT